MFYIFLLTSLQTNICKWYNVVITRWRSQSYFVSCYIWMWIVKTKPTRGYRVSFCLIVYVLLLNVKINCYYWICKKFKSSFCNTFCNIIEIISSIAPLLRYKIYLCGNTYPDITEILLKVALNTINPTKTVLNRIVLTPWRTYVGKRLIDCRLINVKLEIAMHIQGENKFIISKEKERNERDVRQPVQQLVTTSGKSWKVG